MVDALAEMLVRGELDQKTRVKLDADRDRLVIRPASPKVRLNILRMSPGSRTADLGAF